MLKLSFKTTVAQAAVVFFWLCHSLVLVPLEQVALRGHYARSFGRAATALTLRGDQHSLMIEPFFAEEIFGGVNTVQVALSTRKSRQYLGHEPCLRLSGSKPKRTTGPSIWEL